MLEFWLEIAGIENLDELCEEAENLLGTKSGRYVAKANDLIMPADRERLAFELEKARFENE